MTPRATRKYYEAQEYKIKRDYSDALYVLPAQAKPETPWQTFKRQATEDKVTYVLGIIVLFLLGAVIAAQAGIRGGW